MREKKSLGAWLSVACIMCACTWVGCSSEENPERYPYPLLDTGLGDVDLDADVSPQEDVGDDIGQDTVPDTNEEDPLPTHARPLEERLAPMVACLDAFVADDTPTTGVSVAVLEGGEVAWSRGFGVVGIGEERAVQDTTLFRFGSILKMMSSAALLSFVDEGRLTRDTPITQIVPELRLDNADAERITPHMLMTHQGGFEDVLSVDGPKEDEDLESYLLSNTFQEIRFLAPPGRFYNYSNPNFYLVGLLAETLDAAQPYRSVMRERIFSPLGMDRTFFLPEEVLRDGDFAYGVVLDFFGDESPVAPDDYDNAWARPAGYGWSSVLDLAQFAKFVMYGNEEVLSPASWTALRSPQVDTREFLDLSAYGYGLTINDGFFLGENFYKTTLLSHSGALDGYGAYMYMIPKGDFAIVLFANSLLASPGECLALGINAEMERWSATEAPDRSVDPASFQDLSGRFSDVTGRVGEFILRVRQGNVELIAPDLDRVGYTYERILEPAGPNNFVWTTSQGPIVLTAIREEDGRVDYIRSRIFVGVREEGEGDEKARPVRSSAHLGDLAISPTERTTFLPGWPSTRNVKAK